MAQVSNNPVSQAPLFEEEKSNFDIMEWLFKFLHYWYIFVISIILFVALALLQNRKWIPQYMSMGTIIIKESGATYGGSQMLMQGFGIDGGYKNINNQVIILSSYDLMCRVVDSLPFMKVDYITQGRFRTRNVYTNTPIIVEAASIRPDIYGVLFAVDFEEDGTLRISSTNEDFPLSATAHYGQPLKTPLFEATIWPTEHMVNAGKIYFRFRDRGSLVSDFSSRLSLSFVTEGSSVLQLALVSTTPQRDCDFIDKLCQIYLQDNLNRKNDVADNSLRFINQQLEILQQSLSVSESAMTNFRKENKFVDVSAYASTLMQKMENYDAQELTLRLKTTYLDYLANYLETNIQQGGVVAPSSLGLNEPMLMTLVQQLNDLQIQRSELSEKNVYYAKYTTDIENVKAAITEVINSMRITLDIERNDLQSRYAEVERGIQNLPEKELQMVAIERNYRIDDSYYTFFLQKRAEAEIQKASNTPDNSVLDKARVVSLTNASQTNKTMMRYLIIGLIIPLVLVVLIELLNNKIRTPKEAEHLSSFPLIGSIRHAKTQNPILTKSNPRSSYAEMLRTIRTRIEFIVRRKTGIVLTVTSTQSGDGKTYLSTNLAALYAMTGKKTLLIDMDIRKPNVYEKLGMEQTQGVTNYIIGECGLDDIILSDTPYDFDIMQAGTIPPNPGELIRSDKLAEMLRLLRERYEFIIIDSSPIGQVPDAYALIEQTDLTLYVIRCMITNRYFCKNTLQDLSENFKDKIQLILSDIPFEKKGLSIGKGYGYGYGYGYGGYGYGGYGYGYGAHHKKKNEYNYYSDDE
ncbi:MAG: GumC family protein [Paludibacteraceae bacterium]